MKNLSILLSEQTEDREILTEKDSNYQGIFTVDNTGQTRRFVIETNAPVETKFGNDNQRQAYQQYLPNPREINESQDAPRLQSNQIWFDALYALAIREAKDCSVSDISDGSYNNGNPIGNPPPEGYFQTGLFWTYVWTRDSSYSMDLSLANIDPLRALNSLNFKLSECREGGNLQIIQDTGTGGSYPISSDRVVWSLGSRALLRQLQGDTRRNFLERSYEAIKNTIEHDRLVIFDSQDGLYRGEQSFLDWREQTYPAWTAEDPVQIGMSKALSTNCCHFHALQFAAVLAEELGNNTDQEKYHQWAQELRQAIRSQLYLPEQQLYSTYITTTFAPGAAHHYDLLGNALAILFDIADPQQAAQIVANYPHLPKGAAVIWPQQRDTLIYHNQAIWPFVTAYWLRAAKKVANDRAVTLGISTLVRGAALSLSNMENFDAVSGRVELETEPKEPQVNSPRQLWSVAGYLSMVHEIIFGLSWTDSGIKIAPYITREFRNHLLPKSNQLVLTGLDYRNHQLNITLNLPPITEEMTGAYTVQEIRLNGAVVTSEIAESSLSDRNLLEVDLVGGNAPSNGNCSIPLRLTAARGLQACSTPSVSRAGNTQSSSIQMVDNLDDYRYRFAPRSPIVESITAVKNYLEIAFNLNGENPNEVTLNIYRDGQLVASELSGNLSSWQDTDAAGERSPSYCYSLEAVYISSNTISQRSQPFCYWGVNSNHLQSINAAQFSVTGGNLAFNYGREHIENWGKPNHSITVQVKAQFSGYHGIQAIAGNGSGAINTGITCAVKHLEMRNLNNNQVVADGYLIMPQLGTWDRWLESSVIFTQVDLVAGEDYEIRLFNDSQAINMSSFAHNENYTGGNGGRGGAYNYVNIAEIKLLAGLQPFSVE